jgi:hypothetical protein
MTVFMSRRHAYQAKLRHHFRGRHWGLSVRTEVEQADLAEIGLLLQETDRQLREAYRTWRGNWPGAMPPQLAAQPPAISHPAGS